MNQAEILDAIGKATTRPTHCSVEGCDHPVRARGYCNAHYQQYRRTGKITSETLRPYGARDKCRCGRIEYARGMCASHYQRWMKKGDPEWDKPLRGTIVPKAGR